MWKKQGICEWFPKTAQGGQILMFPIMSNNDSISSVNICMNGVVKVDYSGNLWPGAFIIDNEGRMRSLIVT